MIWNVENILMTPPISMITANSVFLSTEFRCILYFFIAIILVLGILFFIKKGFSLRDALGRAIITSFFISSLFYAIHDDIVWAKWLVTDVKIYGGKSTEDKLKEMDDGLYEFALQARQIVTDNYQIFSTINYMDKRMQYYLLPLHHREQAPYIIVIADKNARFDPHTRLFTSGETIIANVKPVLVFKQNAYILKRQ